jgi:heat shock protein HslJ
MKHLRAFSLVLMILVIGGCGSSTQLNPLTLLTGNTWELSSLLGSGVDLTKFQGGIPTLNFLDEGRLAGFAGCNNFSGGFSLEGNGIMLDPGAMTRKACPESGEDDFLAVLGRVKNFKVIKEKLTLLDGDTELMSFIPKKD